MAEVKSFNSEDMKFENLSRHHLALVDFWAAWCGPCKMLSPMVDQVAEERPDIKVCKINVDDEPDLAVRFGVMSIPALKVFKGGAVVNETVGVQPKANILAML